MRGRFQFVRGMAASVALMGMALCAAAGQRPEAEKKETHKPERSASAGKTERGAPAAPARQNREGAREERRVGRSAESGADRRVERPAERATGTAGRSMEGNNAGRGAQGTNRPASAGRSPERAGGERGAGSGAENFRTGNGERGNAGQENRTERRGTWDRPPWAGHLRGVPEDERERLLKNGQKYDELSPEGKQSIQKRFQKWDNLSAREREELRERDRVWRQMTPEQREHVRKDVLPRWQGMPVERRQAIQKRLNVLREMPEGARNRRLGDAEFTRGMSEEDRALLRDLSHLHVGGAPDPPGDEPH